MWLLGRLLPAMVGQFIPISDEHWKNFLLMLQISSYLLAPSLTVDDAAFLQYQIQEHHQQFLTLYPNHSVTPKMHYLVHTPRLILK